MEDSVDRHIARWKGKTPFDDRVEAIVTRMQFLVKYLRQAKEQVLAESGLHLFEFDTLHRLALRGDPWQATPSQLAAELKITPAGITGRLDTLEKAALIRRVRATGDRRRVDVELTRKGYALWSSVMNLIGDVEEDLVGILDAQEQDTLSALLKRLLLHAEE